MQLVETGEAGSDDDGVELRGDGGGRGRGPGGGVHAVLLKVSRAGWYGPARTGAGRPPARDASGPPGEAAGAVTGSFARVPQGDILVHAPVSWEDPEPARGRGVNLPPTRGAGG
ncbi:hypothetical protein GCM10009544_23690 [Streptomyces stramineus]|uniref:Uncharacterized protein n=1 Tax=Streptomyces stramineus TaxID=173861 RepID=A0ABP3JPW9_9ACTN